MKKSYFILIFILLFSCSSQAKISETKLESKSELKPPFDNQGQQEDYWTQELFKKEYEAKTYKKFYGKINVENDNRISFGEMEYFKFNYRLSISLTAAFILITVIGTLTHEFGQYNFQQD